MDAQPPITPLATSSLPPLRQCPAAGKQLWTFYMGDDVRSSPTVSGDTIYVGSYDQGLYALLKDTGEGLWRFPTGGRVYSSPTVSGDAV